MQFKRSFSGAAPMVMTLKLADTVVAGQPGIWLDADPGTFGDPASTIDLTDVLGLSLAAGTYSATQGSEGTVPVIVEPMSIIAARCVPSTTAGTAFAAADGYYLTADSANAAGTTIADTDTGGSTGDMNNGFVFCVDGANVGQHRVITTHTSATSVVVTVPFNSAIAAGDDFVASPYATGVPSTVRMTTDFSQLDGTIAGAGGGESVIVDVVCHTDGHYGSTKTAPYLEVAFIFQDHAFNAL